MLVLTKSAPAQSPPGLSVQLSNRYACLSITDVVGTVCTVQYVTNLAQTNVWLWLADLTLSNSPQSLVDTSGLATAQRVYRVYKPSINMVYIPAGSFTMGDCMGDGYPDEIPTHTVYVSAFWMDPYLVTSNLCYTVGMWGYVNGYRYDNPTGGRAGNHPDVTANWYDAVKWCNARSQREGRTPCYYTDAGLSVVYKTGDTDAVYVNWSANGYRLPTEAEWEKAARGGLSGHRFPWGDTISESQANYASSGELPYDLSDTGLNPIFDTVSPCTSPVGYFAANGYGLYDMAGNACEWCWDWYDDGYYSDSPATNPSGPSSGDERVIRGGGWQAGAAACACAARIDSFPVHAFDSLGFRCVRGY
jgi:formylglycine-generating enzyme required for sulfatase activity